MGIEIDGEGVEEVGIPSFYTPSQLIFVLVKEPCLIKSSNPLDSEAGLCRDSHVNIESLQAL